MPLIIAEDLEGPQKGAGNRLNHSTRGDISSSLGI